MIVEDGDRSGRAFKKPAILAALHQLRPMPGREDLEKRRWR